MAEGQSPYISQSNPQPELPWPPSEVNFGPLFMVSRTRIKPVVLFKVFFHFRPGLGNPTPQARVDIVQTPSQGKEESPSPDLFSLA